MLMSSTRVWWGLFSMKKRLPPNTGDSVGTTSSVALTGWVCWLGIAIRPSLSSLTPPNIVLVPHYCQHLGLVQSTTSWFDFGRLWEMLNALICLAWPWFRMLSWQFNTYSSYFFQIAGFDDPFSITCISTGIQLAVILVVVALVDKVGRRNLCCGGLTTMLIGNTLIGILGVVKSTNVTNKLLVFFTCVYSKSRMAPTVIQSSSADQMVSGRPAVLWFYWLGICRWNLLTATPCSHGRFRCGPQLSWVW